MRIAAVLFVVVLLASCSSRAATPEATTASTPTFDASRAREHAHQLADVIGARVSGTEGEAAAVRYIADEFTRAGYVTTLEPFTFTGNRYARATVTIGGATFEARPLYGAGSGSVRGTLAFAGRATPTEIASLNLAGAIAIADRGEIEFASKLRNVQQAGAIALLVVNDTDEVLANGTVGSPTAALVVSVASSARDALTAAAARGEMAEITSDGDMTESHNVLAKAPGTDRCVILVGGHHDTVTGTPGANDNASGVGHVLELARTFAADGLDKGLCFATFGGEESGLFGSRALADELKRAGALPDAMVNLDVTGHGLPVQSIGTRSLVEGSIEAALGTGVAVVASVLPPNTGSDHMSFADAGVPVLFFTSGDFDSIHTPGDTSDALSTDSFEAVGIAAYASIADLYARLAPP